MSKKSVSLLLTEVELEIMNILWKIQRGSVRDVMAELPEQRTLAYTSASTMLRILEQKAIVQSHKQGRVHIYAPLLKKQDYEENTLNHLVSHVFEGTPSNLVKRLVGDKNLTDSERQQIKSLLADL